MNDVKRRAEDSLEVIDTSEGITREELTNLKQLAKYWARGVSYLFQSFHWVHWLWRRCKFGIF